MSTFRLDARGFAFSSPASTSDEFANSSVSIPNTADDAVSLSRKQAKVAVGAGDWWVQPAANSHLRQLLQRRCQQVRSPTLLQLDIDPCLDLLDPTILFGDFAITCLVVPTGYNVRHTPQDRSTGDSHAFLNWESPPKE